MVSFDLTPTDANPPDFVLTGVFLFEVNDDGLKAFLAASMTIGSANFIDINALGALVISSAGIAFDLEINFNFGGVSDLETDAGFSLTARVLFNNTSLPQEIFIPDKYVQFLSGAPSEPLDGDFTAEVTSLGLGGLTGVMVTTYPSSTD